MLIKTYSIVDKKELLKKNLEVWDIILLNKKVNDKDIWTKLLEAYDNNYDTDFGHAAIIISENPLIIRHSTRENSMESDKDWLVEEVEIEVYLKKCNCSWYDLLLLRPSGELKDKILSFSGQNLWKSYDRNAAIGWWLYWKDWKWEKAISWFKRTPSEDDDSFNCVEIIVGALWNVDQEIQNITIPNQFLEHMNYFSPVYMTTIRCKL